jgi:hypothetical protein
VKVLISSNGIAAMGLVTHCDADGYYIANHPSGHRRYKFLSSSHSLVRLARFVLLPDSYGGVNLLYAVWRLTALRQIGLWQRWGERHDDDYGFCLRAVSRGPIHQVADTWICRTVPTVSGTDKEATNEMLSQQIRVKRRLQLRCRHLNTPYVKQLVIHIRRNPRHSALLVVVLIRLLLGSLSLPGRLLRLRKRN